MSCPKCVPLQAADRDRLLGRKAPSCRAAMTGVALLALTAATGAILFVLITMLGTISGARMNMAVTLVVASRGRARLPRYGR